MFIYTDIYIYIYSLEQQNKWHGICQEGQKKMLKISMSLYPVGFWTQELSNTDLQIHNTILASIIRLLLTRFNQTHIPRICHHKWTCLYFQSFCRKPIKASAYKEPSTFSFNLSQYYTACSWLNGCRRHQELPSLVTSDCINKHRQAMKSDCRLYVRSI